MSPLIMSGVVLQLLGVSTVLLPQLPCFGAAGVHTHVHLSVFQVHLGP